jgi:hypothetical protein
MSSNTKKVLTSIPPVQAAPLTGIRFSVRNSNRGLWDVWKKNEYEDSLQPIKEMGDNAFASRCSKVYINLDFDKNRGSIEDNGVGFGNDPEELTRCFTYGPEKLRQTNLNEHGCGMKSSLAILDPEDKSWSVTWKFAPLIYQVCAPYAKADEFQANVVSKWPGILQDATGTIIEFPFHKESLSSLYSKKITATFDKDSMLAMLRKELSHTWMLLESFRTGKVELFLNGKKVEPFIIPTVNSEYVSKVENKTLEFDGGKLFFSQYKLEKCLEGSKWFKVAMASNGVYFFKNGRFITRVTSGSLYNRIFGQSPHNNHNGTIVTVNAEGDQNKLPITVPTKNGFKTSNNPVYDMMIEWVSKNVHLPKEENPSEESLLARFQKNRENVCKTMKLKHSFETEKTFPFENDKFYSPSLDAYETVGDAAYLYEAKKDNKVQLQTILQIHGNFVLATSGLQVIQTNLIPTPVILIHSDSSYVLPETLVATVNELKKNSKLGFPLEVWNYDGDVLFPPQ